jgi:hypothetical protein
MSNIAKRSFNIRKAILPDGKLVEISEVSARGYVLESYDAYDERRRVERGHKAMPVAAVAADPAKTKAAALIAYASAIEALPEAQSRPAAASAIWANQTAETMPVERAAAFLRGLPAESAPTAPAAPASDVSPQDNARFQRLMEIRIMGLNMKADAGGGSALRQEAMKMGWAIRTRATTGCSFADAIKGAGLDARATIKQILGA